MKSIIHRAALALIIGLSALHAQDNSATFKAHAIPLITDKSRGFLLCKVSAEQDPVHLVIDSGASTELAFTNAFLKELKKEPVESGTVDGIAGTSKRYKAHFDSVNVGGIVTLRDFDAEMTDLSIPLEFDAEGEKPAIGGIVGSHFLLKSRAVVSYTDSKLFIPPATTPAGAFLKERKAAGDRVLTLVKTASGAPFVSINFKGKEFLFLVDTAAGSNILLPEIAKELGVEGREVSSSVTGVGGTAVKPRWGLADDALIGGVVRLPQLDFMIMPTPGGRGLPAGSRFGGILGNSFLKQFKVQIDFDSYHLLIPKRKG